MTFRKLFLSGLICALMAPTNVFADNKKIYLSGSVGVLFTQDADIGSPDATLNATARGANARVELDTGVALTFAVGAEISPQVRGEIEYSFRNADGDKVKSDVGSVDLTGFDADTHAMMFNGYYDFSPDSKWRPYLGGGIGVSWVNIEGNGLGVTVDTTSDAEFSYQVMAGISHVCSESITTSLGYRYFGYSDPTFDNVANASYDTHALELGLRYSF